MNFFDKINYSRSYIRTMYRSFDFWLFYKKMIFLRNFNRYSWSPKILGISDFGHSRSMFRVSAKSETMIAKKNYVLNGIAGVHRVISIGLNYVESSSPRVIKVIHKSKQDLRFNFSLVKNGCDIL